MNFTDIMALAWRNLRQAKLRTALTVIGVVIGVAAIITMVSLGLGLQRNIIANSLSKLDLFTRITVWGAGTDELLAMNEGQMTADAGEGGARDESGRAGQEEKSATPPSTVSTPTATPRVLNDEALADIQRLNGVRYVVPLVSFSSFARFNDRTRRLSISGAPTAIEDFPAFNKFLAGGRFTSDGALEAIVSEDCLRQFNSQVRRGRRGNIGVAARLPEGDRPGVAARAGGAGARSSLAIKTEEERAKEASEVIGKEIVLLTLRPANAAPTSVFGIPLLNSSVSVADPSNDPRFERHVFHIVGVIPSERGPNLNSLVMGGAQMMVPLPLAKRFREANRDPLSQMSQALTGESGYPTAEVRVTDPTKVQPVEDQLTQLGFRAFSITNQIEAIERIFLIINSSLALIGGIALLVASFGISNTMIMSIRERTREIGIMKAIGGSDGEIMRIFFIEASLIGFSGGVLGVLGGWVIDRIANLLANRWIVQQATSIEFFSIPWYLWSGAIAFAILISLIAAIYPALHAAKVDPIKALRHE